jgi:predicted Rossmann-fold nucleotide-binding protein
MIANFSIESRRKTISQMAQKRLRTLGEVSAALKESNSLSNCTIENVILNEIATDLKHASVENAMFVGCEMEVNLRSSLEERHAIVFPNLPNLPYNPYRSEMYSPEELYAGFDPKSPDSIKSAFDLVVYEHWKKAGGTHPLRILDALSQRLHDHSITENLEEFLLNQKQVIALTGGHDVARTDNSYRAVALMCKHLSERGYLVVSGGGPGAMEAAHLGAWFSTRTDADLVKAVSILSEAPKYSDTSYMSLAFEVRAAFPRLGQKSLSLGMPTWQFGDQPTTAFATHIAKYFANSFREDGLVTVGRSGIIFAPGSAGTIQEVFQDCTQNHYMMDGLASAMLFFGVEYWTKTKPVYPVLSALAQGQPYAALLGIFDAVDEIIAFIERHPPISKK